MPPPPPAVVAVPSIAFENYRNRMRLHCAIPNGFDGARCLACHTPATESVAGQREHAKTGVCEACWDLLVLDYNQPVARCTRLAGLEACQYVSMWIGVNRVAPGGNLTCPEPVAYHIIGVGIGRHNLPNLWLPGQRP